MHAPPLPKPSSANHICDGTGILVSVNGIFRLMCSDPGLANQGFFISTLTTITTRPVYEVFEFLQINTCICGQKLNRRRSNFCEMDVLKQVREEVKKSAIPSASEFRFSSRNICATSFVATRLPAAKTDGVNLQHRPQNKVGRSTRRSLPDIPYTATMKSPNSDLSKAPLRQSAI